MLLLMTIGLWIILEPYFKKERNSKIKTNTSEEKTIYNILKGPENADLLILKTLITKKLLSFVLLYHLTILVAD